MTEGKAGQKEREGGFIGHEPDPVSSPGRLCRNENTDSLTKSVGTPVGYRGG